METTKKHIRRDYAPLKISVALYCESQYSPAMQVYNAENGEYEPNRLVSPTLLRPEIIARASDGSWQNPYANAMLTNVKWFENGVDISTISAWDGKYEIDMVGSTRGTITIKRNVLPKERLSLHFEADLADNRIGSLIHIATDPIVLSTSDKSKDMFSVSLGTDKNIFYSPFLDKLLLYNYKVAHGLIEASESMENSVTDSNSWKRTISIEVYRGAKKISTGFSVKLFEVKSTAVMDEVTDASPEIIAVSEKQIVLDLRVITRGTYCLKVYSDNSEVCNTQFSIQRVYPSFSCSPVNGSSILPFQTERFDRVQVICNSNIIECPESVLKIVWKTDTAAKTGVIHNEGDTTLFSLDKTGIGKDYTNDWIDVYVDAIQKDTMMLAADEDDNVYIDEEGNTLIFN